MPVTPEELAARYPRLFHMADRNSWPSIGAHGLLSTSALLDLFEVDGDDRVQLEQRHRPESVRIEHPVHGSAVIRDQKPMRDADLDRALQDGLTPQEWYSILNAHVFFWPTQERLERMLGARAYRDREHLVMTVETSELLRTLGGHVRLSHLNSGATRPFAWPRGRDCFRPLADYGYHERLGRGLDAVAEVAIVRSVPDVHRFVLLVEVAKAGFPRRELPGWRDLGHAVRRRDQPSDPG